MTSVAGTTKIRFKNRDHKIERTCCVSKLLKFDELMICLLGRLFFLTDPDRIPRTVEKPLFNGDLYFDGVSLYGNPLKG